MKLPLNRSPRPPRPAWQMAGCVLLAVLAALAPAALFALTDAARFDRVQTLPGAYVSQMPELDDFYLVRKLHQRHQGSLSAMAYRANDGQVYLGALSNREQMQQNYDLSSQALALLEELEQAGVLTPGWLRAFRDSTPTPYNFYGSTDSLGFMTITYYETLWDDTYTQSCDLPLFSMVVDTHTEAVVSLWIASEYELAPLDPALALPAWLGLLGLNGLGDWAAPGGTFYEGNGLYSAQGELLATCGQHPYTIDVLGQQTTRWYLCLMLCPCDQANLDSARLAQGFDAPAAEPAFAVGELAPVSEACNTGSVYYSIARPSSADPAGLVTVTDYAAARQQLLCRVPGCAHDSEACPSYLENSYLARVFRRGDTVYLCSGTPTGETDGDTPLSQTESRIDMVPADGTARTRLATPKGSGYIDWFACDEDALYGYATVSTGPITQYPLYRVELATGACRELGALYNEIPLEVSGRYLVTSRRVCSQDLFAAWVDVSYRLYDILCQNAEREFALYDLATGARQTLCSIPAGNTDWQLCAAGGTPYLLANYYEQYYTEYLYNELRSLPADGTPGADLTPLLQGMQVGLGHPHTLAPTSGPAAMPYLLLSNIYNSDCYLLDTASGQLSLVAQQCLYGGYPSTAWPEACTDDGRFLVPLKKQNDASGLTEYGLIPARAFCAGSTDYRRVENLP